MGSAIYRVVVLGTVGEKNGALAIGEEARTQVLGCNADNVGMLAQRPIIELGKVSNALLRAGTDRGGPENAVLAELQFAILGFYEKPLDILVRDTRKEENLVKITLAPQFGLPLREAGILDQFARGKGAQRYNRHSSVCRESFEGLGGCR